MQKYKVKLLNVNRIKIYQHKLVNKFFEEVLK